ncbi:dipeptide epimerase [Levilactobacillus suantsaiihabitans]|uniref:Dipeptide epimerase n=1 Tax=Levilactobacillus suantsaiihabitans TaxID=2487722 RepID=A0A4Z0J6J9_9LACO|nr:dipeptide epimerase [Levilactobacillus suantsaiihabitans]TGD17348.1 dipeptide epimerase [Levilactobacillus suantsaiihabitans]
MKDDLIITDVATSVEKIPLKRPFVTHLHTVNEIQAVRVLVKLNNGTTGIGSATPNEVVTGDTLATLQAVIETVIKPRLVGKSLNRFEPLMAALQKSVRYNQPAKAALDIAIYNAWAQNCRQPLTALLGGAKDSMATDYTISIGEPGQMVAEAKALVQKGFHALKVKIGNRPVREDVATITQIGRAVGPAVSLRIDVNQGWTYQQARLGLHLLEAAQLKIDFVEQPLAADQLPSLAKLRDQTCLPIMVDESVFTPADALTVIRAGAADIVNIKLMKSGGIYPATQINQICEAAGISCMVGCMIEAPESLAAAVAFANAHQNVCFIDLDSVYMAKEFPSANQLTHGGDRLWLADN